MSESTEKTETSSLTLCSHCQGPMYVRNPTGTCDHLYWPEKLTDEAKIANGYVKIVREEWVQKI